MADAAELVGVRIVDERALGQRVRGEEHLGPLGERGQPVAHRVGEEREVARLEVPAVDGGDGQPVLGRRGAEALVVLADRRARVVRGEHEPDETLQARRGRAGDRVLDERRRVLLPEHDRPATGLRPVERGRQRGSLGLGARRER